MSSWHTTTLTRADILSGKHFKFQLDFGGIFMAMKGPHDMAMFGGVDFMAENQPYYFLIPSNSEVFTKMFLTANSIRACEAPTASEVSLLVGWSDVWDLLK